MMKGWLGIRVFLVALCLAAAILVGSLASADTQAQAEANNVTPQDLFLPTTRILSSSVAGIPPGEYLDAGTGDTTRVMVDGEGESAGADDLLASGLASGYIVEFNDAPLVVQAKQLSDAAKQTEEKIASMSDLNPVKYYYKAFSLRQKDVPKKVADTRTAIRKQRQDAKDSIRSTLGKRTIVSRTPSSRITGNAVADPGESEVSETELTVTAEFEKTFNGVVLDIDAEQAQAIKELPEVASVSPNLIVTADLMGSIPAIKADYAWAQGHTGKGTTIAVIDTGIDYTHPDLGGCFGTKSGNIAVPSQATQQVTKTYAYVGGAGGLRILDVSDAKNPLIVGSVLDSTLVIQGIAVSDNQAFASSNDRFIVYDITNKSKPVIKVSVALSGQGRGIALDAKYVYLANYGLGALQIFDKATYTPVGTYTNCSQAYDVAVRDGIAFLACNNIDSQLRVVNVSNPASPRFLARAWSSGGARGLDVFMDRAIITTQSFGSGYSQSYDISAIQGKSMLPLEPYYPSRGTFRTPDYAYDVDAVDTVAYILDAKGLSVITAYPNITSSNASYGRLETQGNSLGIAILDGNAYIANDYRGLFIANVSDILRPALLSQNVFDSARAVAVRSEIVLVPVTGTQGNASNKTSSPPQDVGCKVYGGWDFVNNDANPMDDHGHGTHCAGVAAGTGAGGLKGVAPDARLYAYKVLNSGGSGTFANVIAAIERTVDPDQDGDFSDHIDVISMSLGASCGKYSATCGPDDPVSRAVDATVSAGVITVIAAGNSGPTYETIGSPGTARDAITVGATYKVDYTGTYWQDSNPRKDQVTSFSSRGPVTYPTGVLFKPDVLAPGAIICSARYDSIYPAGQNQYYFPCLDTKHVQLAGTSMATPHVAGMAALLRGKDKLITPEEAKSLIKNTADDLGLSTYMQGAGRVNIQRALSLGPGLPVAVLDAPGDTGSTIIRFTGTARGNGFVSYALAYSTRTDFEGHLNRWTTIGISNAPIDKDTLMTWDASTVAEGTYVLRLIVTGSGGTATDYAFIRIVNTKISAPPSIATSRQSSLHYIHRAGSAIDILGTASGNRFERFTLEVCTSTGQCSTSGIALKAGGRSPVSGGLLGTLDTSNLSSDYYYISLKNTYDSKVHEDRVKIYVETRYQPGDWPQRIQLEGGGIFALSFMRQPTLGDLDGDGTKDVLVAYGGAIYAYHGDGKPLSGFPLTLNTTYSAGITSSAQAGPALGDINGDGKKELVVGDNSGYIHAVDAGGNELPQFPKRRVRAYADLVTIEDIDGDGVQDIVYGDWYGYMNVMKGDGSWLPGWPVGLAAKSPYTAMAMIYTPASVYDLDGDGSREIVATVLGCSSQCADGYYGVTIYVLNRTGKPLAGWPRIFSANSQPSEVIIADIDRDGEYELVFTDDENVHALDVRGVEIPGFPFRPDANPRKLTSMTLGDVDGNGATEIFFGSRYTPSTGSTLDCIYGYEYVAAQRAPTPIARYPLCYGNYIGGKQLTSRSYQGGLQLGSLEGNQSQIVLASASTSGFVTELKKLFYFTKAYTWGTASPLIVEDTPLLTNAAPIGDVDNDGDNELFTYLWNGDLVAWSLGGTPSANHYPLYHQNERHTGVYLTYNYSDLPAYIKVLRTEVRNITPYSVIIDYESDALTNATIRVRQAGIAASAASTVSDQEYAFNHSIFVTGLNASTKYSYDLVLSDTDGHQAGYAGKEFYTRSTSSVPALPTALYGSVVTTDGALVPDIQVTASWTDIDANRYQTLAKSLSASEAAALGRPELTGQFIFNRGQLKAKAGTKIEVSAENDLNDPQPFALSNPGGRAVEVNKPLLLSGALPEIIIASPTAREYLATEFPIVLIYNTSKRLKAAQATFNTQALTIFGLEGKPITLNPKLGENTLVIDVTDYTGVRNSKTLILTVRDNTGQNITVAPARYVGQSIVLTATVDDELSDLQGPCLVCFSTGPAASCAAWMVAESSFTERMGICKYTIDRAAYPDGNYTFNFKASDASGNEATGTPRAFRIDKSPPPLLPPPRATSVPRENSLNVSWNKSADPDFQEYRIYRSASPEQLIKVVTDKSAVSFRDVGLQSAGTYTYRITVIDSYGNENAGTAATGKVADTITPTVTINSPAAKTYNTSRITLAYNVSEPATCSYTLNGATSLATTPLSPVEGTNSIQVACTDGTNTGLSATVVFIVDTTPPPVLVTVLVTQVPNAASAWLSWAMTQTMTHGLVYRDTQPFTSVSGKTPIADVIGYNRFTDQNLAPGGTYHYAVIPKDDIGNVNYAPPVVVSLTIKETRPPVVTLVTPAHTTYATGRIPVEYTVDEEIASCTIIVDAMRANTTQQVMVFSLGDGSHSASVQCTDLAGNIGKTPTVFFQIDTGAPAQVTGLQAYQLAGTNDIELKWQRVNASDLSSYRIYRDTYPFTSVSGKIPIAQVSGSTLTSIDRNRGPTPHHYSVTPVDLFGNENRDVVSVPVALEFRVPQVTGLRASQSDSGLAVSLSWNALSFPGMLAYRIYRSRTPFDDISGLQPIATVNLTGFVDNSITAVGTHYYAASAFDISGNENTAVLSVRIDVVERDTRAPTVDTQAIAGQVSGIVLLKAGVGDDLGLAQTCAVCLASDGICDEEWTSSGTQANFSEGARDGACTFVWDTSAYQKRNYTYNFRISDLADNVGVGTPKRAQVIASASSVCSDNTTYGDCSRTLPKYCSSQGILSDSCQLCGCPTGYSCTPTGTCMVQVPTCADGTAYNACSSTKPKYCVNNLLVDRCGQCGCLDQSLCDVNTDRCVPAQSVPNGTCADGSLEGACSRTLPKRCMNQTLRDDCAACGCAANKVCDAFSNACLDKPKPQVTIPLYRGWNVFSVPFAPASYSLTALLAPISGKYASVYSYDSTTKNWIYTVTDQGAYDNSNTLTTLSTGKGYWIYMNEDANLTIQGDAPPQSSKTLEREWNFVSLPGVSTKQASLAFASIANKYDVVLGWDNARKAWRVHSPYTYGNGDELSMIEPGQAYWIYAYERCTWTAQT